MKKIKLLLIMLVLGLVAVVNMNDVDGSNHEVVYFYQETCLNCLELKGYINGQNDAGPNYIELLKAEDIVFYEFDTLTNTDKPSTLPSTLGYDDLKWSNNDALHAFTKAYGLTVEDAKVPILFAGDQVFKGVDEIVEGYQSGAIVTAAQAGLKDVFVSQGESYNNLKSILGFVSILFAGLLDGFNPCAIALLLLFISLLGFTEDKRLLTLVSITYISALFASYFLLGTLLVSVMQNYVNQVAQINLVVSWIIFILVSIFFVLNFYDFLVTRKQDYKNVKNQLPKWIQKMNKRIVKTFTSVMNDTENKKGMVLVLGLTFVLGITLSLTEFVCTGQIYIGITQGISYYQDIYAYIALFFYNIMFVMPLIVIAVISIKSKGIMTTSNWVREHLHIIKLMNSLLFLGIAIYYVYRLFIVGI